MYSESQPYDVNNSDLFPEQTHGRYVDKFGNELIIETKKLINKLEDSEFTICDSILLKELENDLLISIKKEGNLWNSLLLTFRNDSLFLQSFLPYGAFVNEVDGYSIYNIMYLICIR